VISRRSYLMYDIGPENWKALERYVEEGIETGGFLRSCLENDFIGAMTRAHPHSRPDLPDIAQYINWEVPPEAHGSAEAVQRWIDTHKQALKAAGQEKGPTDP
jgi:hypothetical protein